MFSQVTLLMTSVPSQAMYLGMAAMPLGCRHSSMAPCRHGSSIQKIMELGLAVENESSLSDAETEI